MSIQITNWGNVAKIVEKAAFHDERYGKVVIFTNANEWYIPTLVRNLHKSFSLYEPNHKLVVLCSDVEGYDMCKKIGYEYCAFINIPLLDVTDCKNLYDNDKLFEKYTKLCFVKTVIMGHMLSSGYTPLYIDPDMSLKKPCIENLLQYLENTEIVVSGYPDHINTNIMIAKPSSEGCKKMYSLSTWNVDETINLRLPGGDEPFTSTRILFIHKIPFVCVNKEDHPNGIDSQIYKNSFTVHANCTTGLENKINLLKKCNSWYLPRVCIATLVIGNEFEVRYHKFFEQSHKNYAKRCNYEHKIITHFLDLSRQDTRLITMNKLLLCDQEWSNDYDLIIILDGDIVINKSTPPIECSYNLECDKIGVVCELSLDVQSEISFRSKIDDELPSEYYQKFLETSEKSSKLQHLINTGMLLAQPRKHGKILREIYDTHINTVLSQSKSYYSYEQAVVGYELQIRDLCVYLPNHWNAIWFFAKTFQNNITMNEYLRKVYFLHLAGCCDHYDVPYLENE